MRDFVLLYIDCMIDVQREKDDTDRICGKPNSIQNHLQFVFSIH